MASLRHRIRYRAKNALLPEPGITTDAFDEQ